MNFDKLPTELVASIMNKCNYQTVAKMRKTNSSINKIVKGYKHNMLDVGSISFTNYGNLEVFIQSPKFSAVRGTWCGFEREYPIPWEDIGPKPSPHIIYEKIKEILTNISSMKNIDFDEITIDETFVPMLRSFPFDWKKIDVRFFGCDYCIPSEDLFPLWKMFKTADECDSYFNGDYDATNIINDELILQSLPLITFNTNENTEDQQFHPNPGVTDRTLMFLAENRPVNLYMGRFISSFTAQGVMELFEKIVISRDPSIEKWFIGAVQFDDDTFDRILEDFEVFNNDFSELLIHRNWQDNAYGVEVKYQKLDSEERGFVQVALIKSPAVVAAEQLWLELNHDLIVRQRRDFYIEHGIPLDEEMLNLPDEESDMDTDEENENDENNNNDMEF